MTATNSSSGSRGAAFRAGFRARIEAPVAAIFIRTHLTPNMLTLIGFGISVIGAYLAAVQAWIPAGLIVGFGAAFDLFDGALARATGKSSKFGAFMDSTFDRAGEAVVYVGLLIGFLGIHDTNGAILAAAAMAAAFMVSYTRAKSESLGFSSGTGIANVGLAPREVRSVILVVGLLGAAYDVRVLIAAIALIAILAAITTVQRILFVYRQSQS
jgi:CDP-diacylglycerol--glycerol-3-phosphate 3-phosphatidyltransferase